eukprot:gene11711-12932_t
MTNIMESHRSTEPVEYKQFAVASSNGAEDRRIELPPADVIDAIEHGEDENSEHEMQHDVVHVIACYNDEPKKCIVADDEGQKASCMSYSTNKEDNNAGAEIPIAPTDRFSKN